MEKVKKIYRIETCPKTEKDKWNLEKDNIASLESAETMLEMEDFVNLATEHKIRIVETTIEEEVVLEKYI